MIGKAPLREVGRGGDAYQCRDPLRPAQRKVQGDPATHRRADQDDRAFGQLVQHKQRLIRPQRERAVLECAFRRPGARIVEAKHRQPALRRKRVKRHRLRSLHVRRIAGEEEERRPASLPPAIGQAGTVVSFQKALMLMRSCPRKSRRPRRLFDPCSRAHLEEAQMKYRKLGASDLEVSEISLGSWLTYGVGVEADAGARLPRRAPSTSASTSSTPPTSTVAARPRRFLGEALAGAAARQLRAGDQALLPDDGHATAACRARRSKSSSTPRCSGCGPTMSTSTNATATTRRRRSRRRWRR